MTVDYTDNSIPFDSNIRNFFESLLVLQLTTMVHTVGLLGVNGLLGNPTAKVLAQFAREGKLNLVLLHREGKPPKDIDAQHENIELRIIDLDAPASQLEEAVKGINVFM